MLAQTHPTWGPPLRAPRQSPRCRRPGLPRLRSSNISLSGFDHQCPRRGRRGVPHRMSATGGAGSVDGAGRGPHQELGAGGGRPLGRGEGREPPGRWPQRPLLPAPPPQCTARLATTTTPPPTGASAAPWAPTSPSSARTIASPARATPAPTSTAPPMSRTAKVGAALPGQELGALGGCGGRGSPELAFPSCCATSAHPLLRVL